MKTWCLGFIFSRGLTKVLLLRKGASLHTGLWNGIGGAVEEGESFRDSMVRECKEETGVSTTGAAWIRVGCLEDRTSTNPDNHWQVEVFAHEVREAKLDPIAEIHPNVGWDFIENFKPTTPVYVPIDFIPRLVKAPHMATLVHASMEKLANPETPELTFQIS